MAHFHGTVTGSGTAASRLGTAKSGLVTKAASYEGAVETSLYVSNGVDYARVALVPHRGVGTYRVVYDGPVSGGPVVDGDKKLSTSTPETLDT